MSAPQWVGWMLCCLEQSASLNNVESTKHDSQHDVKSGENSNATMTDNIQANKQHSTTELTVHVTLLTVLQV